MQADTMNQFLNILSELAEQDAYSENERKKFADLAMSLAKVKEQSEKMYSDIQQLLKSADEIGNKELCQCIYEMNFQISEEMNILEWSQSCAERLAKK